MANLPRGSVRGIGKAAMGVEIRLFGAPTILRDGLVLRFDTRKATALLAYLSVTARPQRREALAGLLWPQAPESRARATLRRTLSAAAAVGPALRTSGSEVELVGAVCDVGRFEDLAASTNPADLARAADLAQEPFLAGFSLRDSPEFDEWQAAVADRLRDRLATVLASLVGFHAAAGDEASALRRARTRVVLEPLSEPAHRDLMTALARSGDRAAALRQYRALLRTLDRELGVAPLPETAALAAAIRSTETPSWPDGHRRAAPVKPGHTAQQPLVGRGALLAELLETAGAGVSLGITGEPGMGRTAILDALAAAASAAGLEVLTATCRASDRGLPFGMASDLLAPLLRSTPGVQSDDALAGLVPQTPDGPISPGAQRRRLEVVLGLLADRAGTTPLLLLIDDAHLADVSSAAFMGQLLPRLPARVAVIATWPTHGAAEPLPRAVAAATTGPVRRLTGLSQAEVAELCDAESAAPLWERTRGNPRFVLECLAAQGQPSGDLIGLVADRVEGLLPGPRQVLAAAAVLDGPVSADLLRTTAGRDEFEVVEAIEACLEQGLLVETAAGYGLPHEVARGAVLHRTSTARQQLLHHRAATALAARRDTPPAVIARHHRAAGDIEQAERWSWRAAQSALLVRADEEALQHLRLSGEAPAIALATGDVLVRLGQYDAAIVAYEGGLAPPELSSAQVCSLHHRMALVHDRLGEFLQAEEQLTAAASASDPADPARGVVLADRALVRHRLGDAAAAQALAQQAFATGQPAAVARACNVLGLLSLADGEFAAGLGRFEQAGSVARSAHLTDVEVAAGQNASRALQMLHQRQESLQIAQQTLELAERESDLHRVAAVTSQVADVLHDLGRDAEAEQAQRRAAALLAQIALPTQRPAVWLTAEW